MLRISWLPFNFNPIYQRYRFIALSVYCVVFLAGIVDRIYGGIGKASIIDAPEQWRFIIFLIAMLILLIVEFLSLGHKSFGLFNRFQLVSFLIRLLPILTVFLITDLHYTRVLFLIIVLHSYLSISKLLSYGIVILGMLALLILSIVDPILMGGAPPPHITKNSEIIAPAETLMGTSPKVIETEQQVEFLPGPSKQSNSLGGLIDNLMGSFIPLLFTLLLAREMVQALRNQQILEQLNGELEASHTKLEDYAEKVAELATTEERIRLARDIHDGLGHHLAATNIQLEKAIGYRERDPNRSLEALNHAQRSVQDALLDVRESVSSLREEGETFSFDESVAALVRRMKHSELDIKLNKSGKSAEYSKLALMTLYRVIQEGLTNIHKHANASQAVINLDFSDTEVILEITDNGLGFDSEAWAQVSTSSFGLKGLQERLVLVGGSMRINSKVRQTTLEAKLPKVTSFVKATKKSV